MTIQLDEKIYKDFEKRMDEQLTIHLPNKNVKAININLYELSDECTEFELIGSPIFSEDDEDWACDEVFACRQELFVVDQKITGNKWQDCLEYAENLLSKYILIHSDSIRKYNFEGIGVGFVDGNITLMEVPN